MSINEYTDSFSALQKSTDTVSRNDSNSVNQKYVTKSQTESPLQSVVGNIITACQEMPDASKTMHLLSLDL